MRRSNLIRSFNETKALFVLSCAALFLLSLGVVSSADAAKLRPSSEIAVSAGGQVGGQYKTEYFTVDYSYVRVGDTFNISGSVQFSDTVRQNWNTLRDFFLALDFADQQGNLIQEHGLSVPGFVNLNSEVPISFKNSFRIPSQAAYMAFKATGETVGGGAGSGNSPTNFWVDPVKGLNW